MAVKAKHLFSGGEAIYWSGQRDGFSPCNLHDIQALLYTDIAECFGEAFYDYLIEHLVDYSSVESFDFEKTYIPNDLVIYEGVVWLATESVEPGGYPDENNGCWTFAPKFDNDCLNEFWCDASFAKYLSYLVIRGSIVHTSVKLTNSGAVVSYGEGYKSADDKTMRMLQAEYSSKSQRMFNILEKWIKNCEGDCFHCTKQLAISCCGGCGCVKEKCRCDDCNVNKVAGFRILIC